MLQLGLVPVQRPIDRFLNRCKRIGFSATDPLSVMELHSDADNALFERMMTDSAHILQPYLPKLHEVELTTSGSVLTMGH